MIAIMSGDTFLFGPASRARTLVSGEMLFVRGDPVVALFAIDEGAIDLVRRHDDGRETVLQRAAAGDWLAEASLFADAYHCDAVARAPSRVRSLDRAPVLARMEADGPFATKVARLFAGRVREARARADLLRLRRIDDRIDAWLALTGRPLPPRGERVALARDIGVEPAALYRVLARRGDR